MSGEFLLSLLQAAGALLAVLGLLWLLARGARQAGLASAAHPQGRLRLEARLPLDAKRRLLLLRVDEREVVLVVGPHGDTLLGWLPPP
jgi:flagellar protein FliO/FliZ